MLSNARRILWCSFMNWHPRGILKRLSCLNQSEVQVFVSKYVVGWQEKWAVTCELPKDPGEFGCFGEAVLWFDPLKLSLRHSDSADWNRRFRTSLRPCKASMPFVACLHLLSVCLEESWLCQFYLLNVFVEDFRPNFLQVFVMTVRENRMYGWICLEGKLSGAWLSS